jgi:hypothetical protein
MNYESKVTKRMQAFESDLTIDVCSEQDCTATFLVEKAEKVAGRKQRCIACLMRIKLRDSDRPQGKV